MDMHKNDNQLALNCTGILICGATEQLGAAQTKLTHIKTFGKFRTFRCWPSDKAKFRSCRLFVSAITLEASCKKQKCNKNQIRQLIEPVRLQRNFHWTRKKWLHISVRDSDLVSTSIIKIMVKPSCRKDGGCPGPGPSHKPCTLFHKKV